MSAGRKIFDFALDLIDIGSCQICGEDVDVYVGDNYFDNRIKNCGHVLCLDCGSGVVVTETGLMYYFENGEFKRGSSDSSLGNELFDEIEKY